jgi:hypothetical protein
LNLESENWDLLPVMSQKPAPKVSKKFQSYPRLNPLGVGRDITAADLIDQVFLAYNGGRLREAAQLLSRRPSRSRRTRKGGFLWKTQRILRGERVYGERDEQVRNEV